MPPSPLEIKFHEEMLDIYDAAKALGYNAAYFRQMVLERGGVQAAHDLMASNEVSDGFRTLVGLDALHLTVEAHVINPEYASLFSAAEIASAQRRLHRYGWTG